MDRVSVCSRKGKTLSIVIGFELWEWKVFFWGLQIIFFWAIVFTSAPYNLASKCLLFYTSTVIAFCLALLCFSICHWSFSKIRLERLVYGAPEIIPAALFWSLRNLSFASSELRTSQTTKPFNDWFINFHKVIGINALSKFFWALQESVLLSLQHFLYVLPMWGAHQYQDR